MYQKRQPYRNKKIRDAARGEECTIDGPSCNNDPETTVFAHFNEGWAGKGMSQKADDCAGVFACSDCHDWLDGRAMYEGWDRTEFWLRGYYRTIRRLLDKGVLK